MLRRPAIVLIAEFARKNARILEAWCEVLLPALTDCDEGKPGHAKAWQAFSPHTRFATRSRPSRAGPGVWTFFRSVRPELVAQRQPTHRRGFQSTVLSQDNRGRRVASPDGPGDFNPGEYTHFETRLADPGGVGYISPGSTDPGIAAKNGGDPGRGRIGCKGACTRSSARQVGIGCRHPSKISDPSGVVLVFWNGVPRVQAHGATLMDPSGVRKGADRLP